MKAILISFGALLVASACAVVDQHEEMPLPEGAEDCLYLPAVLNQLCNIDMFTVLENIGGGFMPGASCTFGKFYPVSQEEADELETKQRE